MTTGVRASGIEEGNARLAPTPQALKPFATATLVILAPVAIVHAVRLLMGWSVTINDSDVPMWASVIALVVFAGLAIGLWQETRA